ncbi:FYVE zinc finger-domain-containing protein [Fomitopsis serialis]|uniref:FYVE zinc finger-domain-containing protein n=1 Tax=Fomitopsis serialis TaxID=139415 RepID=UPI0020078CDF|nr:FYVE zinc finger-domain-containing protein [Neoantrodia serialis]KAH9915992.1 FYVE zinc finger-domain-containing protein [Neoantrodia serialis]
MNYAIALASSLCPRSSSLQSLGKDSRASTASSQGTSPSSFESCSLSSRETPASSFSDPSSAPSVIRRNEHLAVLLRRHLWKPDYQASRCSIFLCRKQFSIFERKHHCRKCGDIVCGSCSTRRTLLLDTSNLDFINPPRDISISVYASPASPVVQERVCDHCWDQIHGVVTPRLPASRSTPPQVLYDSPNAHSLVPAVSSSSAIHTPHEVLSPIVRPTLDKPVENFGELEAYPLRHASRICKATGGGRWTPKQYINLIGDHLPGQKPQYLIELEREEAERRRQRANPVYEDGDFKLRVPHEPGPGSPGGPVIFSTF